MPQNVAAGALNAVQERLEAVFSGDTPNKYGYNEPGFTIGGLMERNAASMTPMLNEDQSVAGYQLHFLRPGSDTVTQDDAPGTVQSALDCTVASPTYAVSANQTYNHNKGVVSAVAVNDGLAGNIFNNPNMKVGDIEKGAAIVAERLMKGMTDIRKRLDNWGTDFLHATRTGQNNDSEIAVTPFTFNTTSSANRFEAASTKFQEADFLTDISALAANNDIMNHFMVSGRKNFYNSVVDARYRQFNDDERYLTRYNDVDMYFNIRNFDSRLNTATGLTNEGYTFVVGEGTYAIWNYADEAPVAREVAADTWRFTVQDPLLRIMFNGQLRPVTYSVLYKKECTGRDALLRPVYDHKMEISFLGGLVAAPAAEDGHTGILELVGITA